MNKIQRVSLFFVWVFRVLLFIWPFYTAFVWYNAPELIQYGSLQTGFNYDFVIASLGITDPLPLMTRILGFCFSLVPLTIHMSVVYYLLQLFRSYHAGKLFCLENVNYIKKMGIVLLIGQALSPIYQAALSTMLTWSNGPGKRVVMVSFTGTNIAIILAALLIILISWIMAEGYKLQAESELTV